MMMKLQAAEMSKKKKETEEVEKEVKKEETDEEEDGNDSDVEHIETPAKSQFTFLNVWAYLDFKKN